ncbi:phosphotransferase [Herbivorax sp. ANBcel31]|uniref:phosphotransferase n=1 Tax=Herbivorax sp. ANBcel31 TaxID=3069754 RepID=UPI0027B5BD9D|nr:phosphotransferase [Herbivorax sp. ANBcel31]MDQ2086723.1 phosphotransferase [Herbivorax sp. ANBcel31]
MNKYFKRLILKATQSRELHEVEEIQELWGGYGKILRYGLSESNFRSVIVKNVCLPDKGKKARGSNISYQRKLKSYKMEMAFYKNWSKKCNEDCRVANWYALEWQNNEFLMVLEDLDLSGFKRRMQSATWNEMRLCLKWLANFHATFIGEKPEGLWTKGTYWHLETRPDELKALKDTNLKSVAKRIDGKLNNCRFKTFVHGDAKLENFCLSEDKNSVAAVDFQYVGGGCGMKDVAYFVDSCLYDEECESWEEDILNFYFGELEKALIINKKDVDFEALEKEWRILYPVAWTDFYRFFKGWAPGNYESKYSERILDKVINSLNT